MPSNKQQRKIRAAVDRWNRLYYVGIPVCVISTKTHTKTVSQALQTDKGAVVRLENGEYYELSDLGV